MQLILRLGLDCRVNQTKNDTMNIKKLVLVVVLLTVATFDILWVRQAYKAELVLQEQQKIIAREQVRQKQVLVTEKIAIMNTLAKSVRKQFGDIDDLHIVDGEFTPKVINQRWEEHLKGIHEENSTNDICQATEVAIEQLLFTEELLKNDYITAVHPTFCDIAREKGMVEINAAQIAAHEKWEFVAVELHKRESEIVGLTWKQVRPTTIDQYNQSKR